MRPSLTINSTHVPVPCTSTSPSWEGGQNCMQLLLLVMPVDVFSASGPKYHHGALQLHISTLILLVCNHQGVPHTTYAHAMRPCSALHPPPHGVHCNTVTYCKPWQGFCPVQKLYHMDWNHPTVAFNALGADKDRYIEQLACLKPLCNSEHTRADCWVRDGTFNAVWHTL